MELKTNRILVTSFASNVARMESIFIVRKKQVEIFVWSVGLCKEFIKQPKKCGYLQGLIEPIDQRDAKKIAKNKIIYLSTGSQGDLWEQ